MCSTLLDARGRPVKTNHKKWSIFLAKNRVLKQDMLPDGTTVSTVFLGVDTSLGYRAVPVLWETMISGGGMINFRNAMTVGRRRSKVIKGPLIWPTKEASCQP